MRIVLFSLVIGLFLFGLTGCEPRTDHFEDFVTGKVTKIEGALVTPSVSGTVTSDAAYMLQVACPDGTYLIQVNNVDAGPQTIYALNKLIKVGTQITFPRKFVSASYNNDKQLFSSSKIGVISSNEIAIVPEKIPQEVESK